MTLLNETIGARIKPATAIARSIDVIVEKVPADQLGILNTDAQRDLDKSQIKRITDGFKIELFGHLDVTMPNDRGICHIMDGQHRWHAARELFGDNVRLPCRVHGVAADDYASQSRIFADLNTQRKRVDELSLFRARRAQGCDDEVHVSQIVRETGLDIGLCRNGNISCPAALLAIFRKPNGPSTLIETLKVLRCAYGDNRTAFSSPMLRGFALFLESHPDAEAMRLIKKLRMGPGADPGWLINQARTAREINRLPTTPAALSFVVTQQYNYNAKKPLKDRS